MKKDCITVPSSGYEFQSALYRCARLILFSAYIMTEILLIILKYEFCLWYSSVSILAAENHHYSSTNIGVNHKCNAST